MAVIAQASKGSATLDEQNWEKVQNLMQMEDEISKLQSEVCIDSWEPDQENTDIHICYTEIKILSGIHQSQQSQGCKHHGRQCSYQANREGVDLYQAA